MSNPTRPKDGEKDVLTRESVENLARYADSHNIGPEDWDALLAHDAAMRADLARLKEEREEVAMGCAKMAQEILALRASRERMREALTPSAETKAAYIGEFEFEIDTYSGCGELYQRTVAVPWTTIKEIMAAILARAALSAGEDK